MPRNPRRAARLYQQTALAGHLQAQANLAAMLLDGNGVREDAVRGLQWLRRAARRGDPIAQYNLGRDYVDGEVVKKNKHHARMWLSKAADSGHRKARRLLKSKGLRKEGSA
jgi:TPR repeat protein